MFIDEAEIYVKAGNGGDGCSSFRREKFVDMGGPDGGDGGDGGSVYLRAHAGLETLMDFASRHHWRAENGRPGEGSSCTGRRGEDLYIDLPQGTLVYDRDTGVLLKDLAVSGELCCIAQGGKGGRGNRHFASATHQAPTEFERGQAGEERQLRLELKLIADVGLVGLPNAGKSTLLSRLSHARPRIGAYPFTTKKPQLGIMELDAGRRIVVADIPGLIQGAHTGAGLGDAFLRHIERTRVIVHMIDIAPVGGPPPKEAYEIIREELCQYSDALAQKPELVVANKMDLAHDEQAALTELRKSIGADVVAISAATGKGLKALMQRMWSLAKTDQPGPVKPNLELPVPPHKRNLI